MKWTPQNHLKDFSTLGSLLPERVFIEYDGPILFSSRDDQGRLLLAYLCDEANTIGRYLVVPASARLLAELEDGVASILQSIRQPRSWLVDVDLKEWTPISAYDVEFESLPDYYLPKKSAFLSIREDAAISMRLIAEKGSASAFLSMMKYTAEKTTICVRKLIDHMNSTGRQHVITAKIARQYADLPILQVGLASFEVVFGVPANQLGSDESPVHDQIVNEIARLLRRGIEWLANEGPDTLPSDDPEALPILNALLELVPSSRSGIKAIELGGQFVSKTSRKTVLTSERRAKIRGGIQRIYGASLTDTVSSSMFPSGVFVIGVIQGIDHGPKTFVVREFSATAAYAVAEADTDEPPMAEEWPFGDEIHFEYYGEREEMLNEATSNGAQLRVTGLLIEPVKMKIISEGVAVPLYRSVDIVILSKIANI